MKRKSIFIAVPLLILAMVLPSCAGGGATGTLEFYANGEDFVRQGFVSKDGWSIQFDHVYITLSDVTAYQTDPPYDPQLGAGINGKYTVGLDKVYTIDLAEGDEDALPILVGKISDVPAGHYNAVSWKMVKAESGPAAGYSLVMIGTAQKDGQSIDFVINVEEECDYQCGEYVGDERKGIVQDGGTADLEMTFHFDHIFGDADTPLDDELNLAAIGFEPFAGGAQGEEVINMTELHLGHVGEGHCHCGCH
jgi:hypothetical protein